MNDIIKLLNLEDPNVIISSVNVQDGCKELCFTAFVISDECEMSSSGPRISVSGVRSS